MKETAKRYNILVGYRNMLDLTQEQMGEVIKRSKPSYCRRENGEQEFKYSEMELILARVNENFPLMTMFELFAKK